MYCPYCNRSVNILSRGYLNAKAGSALDCPHCNQPVVLTRTMNAKGIACIVGGALVAWLMLFTRLPVYVGAPLGALAIGGGMVLATELKKPAP